MRRNRFLLLDAIPVYTDIYLINDPIEPNLVKNNETFGSEISVWEMVFWNSTEIVGTTLIAGLRAWFFAGFRKGA